MKNTEHALNRNILWAATFVAELAACGVEAVCIGPGSRSTPLTLAFDRHPSLQVFLHLDERSAGFAALGIALATDRPVGLVCTSGTAAAEFFPALIEARQSQVPLLVLTADRPHELRQSGANQTIDQVKLYGDQVLWSVDVALPEADPPPEALDNLRTLAARAVARANGIEKGPVHLNFPFRKPLEPPTLAAVPNKVLQRPHTEIARGRLAPTEEQLNALARLADGTKRGIIVCGPRCPSGEFAEAVTRLAHHAGWPILADPLSGVRYGPQVDKATVVSSYESLLNPALPVWESPELILRFGAVPTSKWLNEYLYDATPEACIHVRASGVWADDSHRVSHFVQADEVTVCAELASRLPAASSGWTERWAAADRAAQKQARAYFQAYPFDAAYVAELVHSLPPGANLFVGNSLPVRYVDQFGAARSTPLHVYANRGASGIDGTTSSALAIAAAEPERPLVFLTGDVAFYHDMNGLLALRRHSLRNVTIVLLNNDGGGIFRRLPVARLDPAFTDLFVTPHGLDFVHVAALYGLEHERCASPEEFSALLQHAVQQTQPTLVEIQTDGEADVRHARALVRELAAKIVG